MIRLLRIVSRILRISIVSIELISKVVMVILLFIPNLFNIGIDWAIYRLEKDKRDYKNNIKKVLNNPEHDVKGRWDA